MTEKMTAEVAVTAITQALAAVIYLHKAQQVVLAQDGTREPANAKSEDFNMKDTRASEGTRANHERLVKSLEKALARARSIASAEASILKAQSPVRVVKVSSDLVATA